MAAHVRFGARTGGALVILGAIVLFTGLFLADSGATLFKLFPHALLGVILMFGGLELAAGVSMWNMGVGYVAGLALWYAFARGWLKA